MQVKTLKQLFQRYRRPGNLFFASCFLALSLFLTSQIGNQTIWKPSTRFASQPAFWPMISLYGMTLFAVLNWLSAAVSPKIAGRWGEVVFWLRSLEFAAWFMAYVFIVPLLGYLLATMVFAVILSLRAGYRTPKMIGIAVVSAVSIVVIFKAFLQVKVPGGQIYEYLPDFMRAFMLTYF